MFACRDCIEYFTVRHLYYEQKTRYRLVTNLDPNLNALVWGMVTTWHVAAIAGGIIALLSRTPFPGLTSKISSAQLAPYLSCGAIALLGIAHIKAKNEYTSAQKQLDAHNGVAPSNNRGVPSHLIPGWWACEVRNETGYLGLAAGIIALSIAIIAARAGVIPLKTNVPL